MYASVKILIMVTLSFFLLGSSLASAGIITGPIVNPANGHTYYLLTPQTWTDSQAEAFSLGGNLATVDDVAENDWIVSYFANFGAIPRALWIGLTDFATEGTFVWVSGDPVLYTNWGPASSWQVPPEPNNWLGIEDWAQIFPPSDFRYPTWNDAPNVVNPFGTVTNGVVEVSRVVPEPSSLVLLGFGMASLFCCCRWRRA